MSQDDVKDALTPAQVIDMFSCLIKDGFTEDLLEKFAYINLGEYDGVLDQKYDVYKGSISKSEKQIFNGIVLKAKDFPQLLNATVIGLIYRTVETASKETLSGIFNDKTTFVNNLNSVTSILNQAGKGLCKGYSVYISDNPRQVLKALKHVHGPIQFNNKKLMAVEKELDKDFDKDKLYILVCGYTYCLETSGQALPYTLDLGTIDLNKK